ncbi:MAG: CRTAC1 family protein [Alphaproteobacteria bacterium]|nr:CRTAC1 family protein [Alphaproteobacteria bacterium]
MMRPTLSVPLMLAAMACATAPVAPQSEQAAAPSPSDRLQGVQEALEASPAYASIKPDLELYRDLRDDVFGPLAKAFEGGALPASAAEATGPDFAAGSRTLVRTVDDVAELAWSASGSTGLQASIAGLGLTQVASATFEVEKFERTADGVQARVAFDVRGTGADGVRRQDRGEFLARLASTPEGTRLQALELVKGESLELQGRAPTFTDATADLGLASMDFGSRSEAIRRGGYAIAAGDVDGDGAADILLGSYGPMKLMKRTATGYEDVTERMGLQGETKVKSAAIADFDNDGHKDLVLARFVEPGETEQGDFVAYRNRGDGTFERKGDVLTRNRKYDRSMPIATGDFDGNGLLDVYVGFPGARDFTNQLSEDATPATLASQGVWLNQGDWTFGELAIGPDDVAKGEPRHVYPHAALVTDLNRDGLPDVLITDDSGSASPIYYNQGDGKFREVAAEQGLAHSGWGMGTAVGDYDGDGHLDVYMSAIDLRGSRALLASLDPKDHAGMKEALDMVRNGLPPNVLFHNKGDGTFEEVGEAAGVRWAGSAPAVAEWIDYNDDGRLDLYVPNGLWSGGEQEIEDVFFAASVVEGLSESETDGDAPVATDHGDALFNAKFFAAAHEADPNPMLTILREFKGDLAHPKAAGEAAAPTLSFGGHERNRLFRNNGDGSFTEVGYLEGADRVEDGYVATIMDADRDGRSDLMLRNCDHAPGHDAPALVLLQNTRTDTRSLAVVAEGSASNRDGIGAVITATIGDRQLVREIRGVTGAVQHEPTATFGLGDAEKVDRLEVRFPNGSVQVYEDVKPGRVKVAEGITQLTSLAAR